MFSWLKRMFAWLTGGELPAAGAEEGQRQSCGHQHAPQLTPEQDFEIASAEVEAGNLPHATFHLACALAADPGKAEYLALLHQIEAAADDPLELVPAKESMYFAEAAARAYFLAAKGRFNEALQLLDEVVHAGGTIAYVEEWGLDWLDAPGALGQIQPAVLARTALLFIIHYREHPFLRRKQLERIERLLAAVKQLLSQHRDAMLAMVLPGLLRKLGRSEEAIAQARQNLAADPGYPTAVSLACALRYAGRFEESVQAYQDAQQYDPQDVSVFNDLGDMYAARGDWTTARKWFEKGIARQPRQRWALPSRLFCLYRETGEEKYLDELGRLRDDPALAPRVDELLFGLVPYVGYLPEPADATANIIRQFEDQRKTEPDFALGGELKLHLNLLECPSNYLALEVLVGQFEKDFQFHLTVDEVQSPDPREPDGPLEHVLWRYDGIQASRAIKAPSQQVSQAVASLARQPFHEEENWCMAGAIADSLAADQAVELLAAMIHPAPPPEGTGVLVWLPRVQLAAAQILANLDGGWEGSLRRKLLLELARGPIDWTTEAAIFALSQVAREMPAARSEIRREFSRLLDRVPKRGHLNYLPVLLYRWPMIPDLPPSERDDIVRRRKAWEQTG
jgi:tetratricopeptide (TPR) repeat protein